MQRERERNAERKEVSLENICLAGGVVFVP